MQRRASACRDLLAVLQYADRRSNSDKAMGQAMAELHAELGPGDQYVSVEPMAATSWRTMDTRRGPVRVPDRWEPVATRWVLADLDGFDDGPLDDRSLATAGEALERWAASWPGLSGRVAVVRTSHLGVQVVAELAEPQDPRRWHRTRAGQELARALDVAAMAAARGAGFAGGHADQCVHTAGRLMRRPGWRVDKGGTFCRSRLAFASAPGGS